MDRAVKNPLINFTKYFFISQNVAEMFISQNVSCNAEKNITVEDNKKRMNITNFINIYTNIYTYIICDKNDSK